MLYCLDRISVQSFDSPNFLFCFLRAGLCDSFPILSQIGEHCSLTRRSSVWLKWLSVPREGAQEEEARLEESVDVGEAAQEVGAPIPERRKMKADSEADSDYELR
jgi:hypothetical protein